MVDIVLTSLQFSAAARSGATERGAATALELGSDNFRRNPQTESLARVFGRPSSGGVFSSLESFMVVAEAQAQSRNSDFSGRERENSLGITAALDLFLKRETSAEARLRELLGGTQQEIEAAASEEADLLEEADTLIEEALAEQAEQQEPDTGEPPESGDGETGNDPGSGGDGGGDEDGDGGSTPPGQGGTPPGQGGTPPGQGGG
ncbi:MAG: hypothetical protein EA357_07575 [Micavibrio sp.]|nr:MAG: hypothetical protein EA357_07575 [Micavibrio sp.]